MRIDDDDLPLMLWTARPDLSCDYVSRAWLDFTGFTAAQALGHGWSRALHPEDLVRWLEACVQAFDAREPFCLEYRLRRRDGGYRWVLERAAPRSVDGVFAGFAGTCVDIDEAKRAHQGLARSLERERRLRLAVEEASRAKDRFLAAVIDQLQVLRPDIVLPQLGAGRASRDVGTPRAAAEPMNPDKNRERRDEHWPFDPLQPGDHEPARLPEESERVQKQTGHGEEQPSPDYRKSTEKPK